MTKIYYERSKYNPNGKAVYRNSAWYKIYEPKEPKYPIRLDNLLLFVFVLGLVIYTLATIF